MARSVGPARGEHQCSAGDLADSDLNAGARPAVLLLVGRSMRPPRGSAPAHLRACFRPLQRAPRAKPTHIPIARRGQRSSPLPRSAPLRRSDSPAAARRTRRAGRQGSGGRDDRVDVAQRLAQQHQHTQQHCVLATQVGGGKKPTYRRSRREDSRIELIDQLLAARGDEIKAFLECCLRSD